MEKLKHWLSEFTEYNENRGYLDYEESESWWESIETGLLLFSETTVYPRLTSLIKDLIDIYNNSGYYEDGGEDGIDSILVLIEDYINEL